MLREFPTVSVITSKPVPKSCIDEVMKRLVNVVVEAPVEIGQVILEDICGVDIIATRRVRRISN